MSSSLLNELVTVAISVITIGETVPLMAILSNVVDLNIFITSRKAPMSGLKGRSSRDRLSKTGLPAAFKASIAFRASWLLRLTELLS